MGEEIFKNLSNVTEKENQLSDGADLVNFTQYAASADTSKLVIDQTASGLRKSSFQCSRRGSVGTKSETPLLSTFYLISYQIYVRVSERRP